MRITTTRVAVTMIIVGLLATLAATFAEAHSWYEPYCCDERDCRPISGVTDGAPWSEIEDMGDRYVWRSSATGHEHIIPKGDERIRPSRDGHYHACEVTGDVKPDVWARCLYVPALF